MFASCRLIVDEHFWWDHFKKKEKVDGEYLEWSEFKNNFETNNVSCYMSIIFECMHFFVTSCKLK